MKKVILAATLMMIITVLSALDIYVEENKFLDSNQNTLLEIGYQIPFAELTFEKSEMGFTANVKVTYQILKSDKVLVENNYSHEISVGNEALTSSPKLYKDKLTLTLAKSGYLVKMSFEDMASQEFFDWNHDFSILERDALVSDIELSRQVYRDTTLANNLRRGSIHFDIAVDHLFMKPDNQNMVLYYEIQNFFAGDDGNSDVSETITIHRDDKEILTLSEDISQPDEVIRRLKNVEIADLEPGYYKLLLTIKDNITGMEETKEDFFLVKEHIQQNVRLFTSVEDEIRLIRYFVSATKISDWEAKSEEAKQNIVNQFWMANDPDPTTPVNEFYDIVKERVNYANDNFSHFEDGWTTDRGRIYVKNGAPDEISTTKTGFYTKYAQKDVEIWKYRYSQNLTYLFVDFNTNGNHKLIYNEYDEEEDIFPDWLDYLGEEFDESLLQ